MPTKIKIIKYPTDKDWILTRNEFLTSKREESDTLPSQKLKLKYLVSEHTPIYGLQFSWEWIDLPYYVSVHFSRHHVGIYHIVSSQRNDIQFEYDRKKAPQDSPVNHRCVASAQAILNISKARKCTNASIETRQAWQMFLDTIQPVAPELVSLCVKPCIYRNGICPEVFKTCGFNKTEKFQSEMQAYLNIISSLYK